MKLPLSEKQRFIVSVAQPSGANTALSQLQYRPLRNRFLVPHFVAALLLGWFYLTAAHASDCVEGDVRELIDAITNQRPNEAQERLASIREHYPSYRLSDFYQSVIEWSRNQFTDNNRARTVSRKQMVKAIDDLEEQFKQSSTLDNQFAVGVAQGLAARIFIFDEQYLKAYRLGSAAKEHISAVHAADPERDDARLFIGLFEYYTSSVPDELSWLSRLIDWSGSRDQGVKHLEYAVEHSPTFSHEAARALLMEVNWRLPDVCGYLPLAEWLVVKNGDNPYFSLTLQGIYLRCGQPEKALLYNEMMDSLSWESKELTRARSKAKFRALSQKGDVAEIKRLGPSELSRQDNYAYWFALANAYDVLNMHEKAVKIYQKLAKMDKLAPRFVSMAKLRLTYPYTAPKRIEIARPLSIAQACKE